MTVSDVSASYTITSDWLCERIQQQLLHQKVAKNAAEFCEYQN